VNTTFKIGRRLAFALAVLLQSLALVAHLASHTADATTDSIGGQERFSAASHPAQAVHLDAPAGKSLPDDSACICGQHCSAPERAPTARQELANRSTRLRVAQATAPASPLPTGPARAPPAA
jgi:hypothetical protein